MFSELWRRQKSLYAQLLPLPVPPCNQHWQGDRRDAGKGKDREIASSTCILLLRRGTWVWVLVLPLLHRVMWEEALFKAVSSLLEKARGEGAERDHGGLSHSLPDRTLCSPGTPRGLTPCLLCLPHFSYVLPASSLALTGCRATMALLSRKARWVTIKMQNFHCLQVPRDPGSQDLEEVSWAWMSIR